MEVIEDSTFFGCSSLEMNEIPEHISEIRDSAFAGCTALENVEFDNQEITIGRSAFASCSSLNDVKLPENAVSVASNAFFTATLYAADGNVLAEQSIEMNSKAGFFDKIASFFRAIFGRTQVYEN